MLRIAKLAVAVALIAGAAGKGARGADNRADRAVARRPPGSSRPAGDGADDGAGQTAPVLAVIMA